MFSMISDAYWGKSKKDKNVGNSEFTVTSPSKIKYEPDHKRRVLIVVVHASGSFASGLKNNQRKKHALASKVWRERNTMEDFPIWLKIVVWAVVGGTMLYAVVASIGSIFKWW